MKRLDQRDGSRADPNRPRLRQGSDPAEALYREQARRDSEVAHQYLNELTNRRSRPMSAFVFVALCATTVMSVIAVIVAWYNGESP